jgi:hypothetical protein
MKIEITHTKEKGAQITLVEQPKEMDDIELASIIEDVIQDLRSMQLSLMPNNDQL